MMLDADFTSPLEIDGRLWLRGALDEAALAPFDSACVLTERPGARMQGAAALAAAIRPGAPLTLAMQGVMPHAHAVRAVAFNKSPGTNWSVPWHQDRVIAVQERHEAEGFTNWSSKAGVWHAEPPREVLEQMLFVRVHLDDADADNGAMEIALGSHREGVVAARDAADVASRLPSELCVARRGDVLVMKMLTLHRSSRATSARPRRSFRIDYACAPLPDPLDWAM